jgi:histidyl-tRNA synthetase
MSTLKAVRGTRDLLPPETELWNRVESTARAVFARYNFGEIRTPIFEDTQLFARGVGEETDIVSKEMYTWEDGERFDIDAMENTWWRNDTEYQDRLYGIRADKFGVNAARVLSNHTELLMFRGRLDQSDIKSLEDAIAAAQKNPHAYSTYRVSDIRGRLVVVSPVPDKPVQELGNSITVNFLHGKFTKSSQSLTLRPENTAGVVRAYIEHKLGETGLLQKLYYIGSQFRRERPQKGRYRQFWQIGAEVIGPPSAGSESPLRDAEVLEMLATLLNELGISGWTLVLNSVGSMSDRPRYIATLREALKDKAGRMCSDCQRRAETNPLRVLDCKVPDDQPIIDSLPKIVDYLDEDSKAHFAAVLAALDACGVKYELNPRLVRGLDYYTRTAFEFTHGGLGAQNALLGGGRYDGLSEAIGGPKAPGIGFAIGLDRLILTLQAQEQTVLETIYINTPSDAYIAPLGEAQNPAALSLARDLRAAGLRIELGDGSFRLKKSFEIANKLARKIVLLGEDELRSGILTVKDFASGEQNKVSREQLATKLRE